MTKRFDKYQYFALFTAAVSALLVFFCMFFSNGVAQAANPDSLTYLSIDGEICNVSGDEAQLEAGETSPRWVLDGGILTLNGYTGGAIIAHGDLTVFLTPSTTNSITTDGSSGLDVSESATGDGILTMNGSGILVVNSHNSSDSVSAVSAVGGISVENCDLRLAASSDGTDASNGIARAVFSEKGTVSFTSAKINASAEGAYGYSVNTGSSAAFGTITLNSTDADLTSEGTISDTALRADSMSGNLIINSSAVNLNSKKYCTLGADITLTDSSVKAVGENGGLNARYDISVSGGSLNVNATTGTSVSVYGVRCESGDFSVSGESSVYIEAKVCGVLVGGNMTVNSGKTQIIANGTGSYAVYSESGVAVNGGTVMASGMNSGVVAVGAVTSHGTAAESSVLQNQTVYFAADGQIFGGGRFMLKMEGELFCQFETVDRLESEGWSLGFDFANASFLLTLDGYDGGEIYTDNKLHIVLPLGSVSKITTATDSPAIYSKDELTFSGGGYLEAVGANIGYASAIYAKNAINLYSVNLVAKAGGNGLSCYDGTVTINGGRVSASGGNFTIYSKNDLKLGETTVKQEDFSSTGVYFNDGTTFIKNNIVSTDVLNALTVGATAVAASSDASGEGWFWSSKLNYLLLDGYDGSYIWASGALDLELAAGSANIITNSAARAVILDNLSAFVGVASTGQLNIFGTGSLVIKVSGAKTEDITYALYSSSGIDVSGCSIEADSSYSGVYAKTGALSFSNAALNLETMGDAVTAYGNIAFKDCEIEIVSYKYAIYSKIAGIVFDGGNASVYGQFRSAVANLDMTVGESVYVTGTLSDATASELYSAFYIADGVLTSTFEKAMFKIMGANYDYSGEAIDRLDSEGWKFDYDAVNSKYILQLKNYDGGSIRFSLNLEIQLLDGGVNTVSFADNVNPGEHAACIDVNGSLVLIGNGSLILTGGGTGGGIGIYTGGGCIVNGDVAIDSSAVARGIACAESFTLRNGDYVGSYITADSVYVYGGSITIDAAESGMNCIEVASLFHMSGGTLNLALAADGAAASCIKSLGTVSLMRGSFKATASGEYGVALTADGLVKLFSPSLDILGGGRAVDCGDGSVLFGDSVLAFAGNASDSAEKIRALSTQKYLKTQEFIFEPADLSFDNLDGAALENGVSFDLSDNMIYFEGLKYNGRQLVLNTDFSVQDNALILSPAFLQTLPNGICRLEVHFGGGFYKIVSMTVSNANPPVETVSHNPVGMIVVLSISALLIAAFIYGFIASQKKSKKD